MPTTTIGVLYAPIAVVSMLQWRGEALQRRKRQKMLDSTLAKVYNT
jgi:hypothetical protein